MEGLEKMIMDGDVHQISSSDAVYCNANKLLDSPDDVCDSTSHGDPPLVEEIMEIVDINNTPTTTFNLRPNVRDVYLIESSELRPLSTAETRDEEISSLNSSLPSPAVLRPYRKPRICSSDSEQIVESSQSLINMLRSPISAPAVVVAAFPDLANRRQVAEKNDDDDDINDNKITSNGHDVELEYDTEQKFKDDDDL